MVQVNWFAFTKRSFSICYSSSFASIKHVTIIGGGRMGIGIAQATAKTGHQVTLVETNADLLKTAQENMITNVTRAAKYVYKDKPTEQEQFVWEIMNRLSGSTNAVEAVQNADLVVEAVVENIQIKQKLFQILDEAAPAKTIFASNTSSLSVGDIASVVKRKDRFGGLHFSHPAALMKLLEVIPIAETSSETYNKMMEWGKRLGKVCITCKDTPGFILNRLLIPNIAEAIRMYEEGVASVEDIDSAMIFGTGCAKGPLQTADHIGLDVLYYILSGWHQKYPDNAYFKPPNLLKKMFDSGKFGVKTGEGFYTYKEKMFSAV